MLISSLILRIVALLVPPNQCRDGHDDSLCPPPPVPEPITMTEISLPPVAPRGLGSCDNIINPLRTGCIDKVDEISSGNFLPDNEHIVATVTFTGAPEAPDPASIYNGTQVIIIKTDGTNFSNGSPWKCVTCGIPAFQKNGSTSLKDYPYAFDDGRRIISGNNIIDGGALLTSDDSTPETTWIYPIRWNDRADNTGTGAEFREIRLHPDQVHLGFNAFTYNGGSLGQFAYYGKLEFNPNPSEGNPLSPRYDLVNVTRMFSLNNPPRFMTDNGRFTINTSAIIGGEFRGWGSMGKEALFIGGTWEANNIDAYGIELKSGYVRRLTSAPGYVDPIDFSHDGEWFVIEDTRGTNRTSFMDAMRNIPPVSDILAIAEVSSIRNNGQRRFFLPWLLDRCGDRGNYEGQLLNANAGDGSPGSLNDPNWNARADPRWSWDGTKIAWHESIVTSPDCGGSNPLPCPNSTAQGGREWRIVMAQLTSRKPVPYQRPSIFPDEIPWGEVVVPGAPLPHFQGPSPGNYTMFGQSSGSAQIQITADVSGRISAIEATYNNYSDDSRNFLSGSERLSKIYLSLTSSELEWHSNLTSTGEHTSTKITSPGGFKFQIDIMTNKFNATGSLVTTVDGYTYHQPLPFT